LLIGLPIALVALVGWPLPDHVPTQLELEAWVQEPLTRDSIICGAAIVTWTMWAGLLAVDRVGEMVGQALSGTGTRSRRQ
jgi:hypothetical protein